MLIVTFFSPTPWAILENPLYVVASKFERQTFRPLASQNFIMGANYENPRPETFFINMLRETKLRFENVLII